MFEQMVLVQERGSKKKPIRIHSSTVEEAVSNDIYDMIDNNWEMPSGKLRRKVHPDAQEAPKKRRGRPPKQEMVEVPESDD